MFIFIKIIDILKARSFWFGFLIFVIMGIAASFWFCEPVSNQELLANFSKAQNFYTPLIAQKSIPWWSPMYLQGTSLAFAWVFMATNISILVFSIPFGYLVGTKIATLSFLWVGAIGMFIFLSQRKIGFSGAIFGGLLFLFNPSVLTRAFEFEHYAIVLPMAILPWLLWAVMVFFEKPTLRASVLLSVIFSGLFLSYGKAALIVMPALFLFSAIYLYKFIYNIQTIFRLALLSLVVFILLAVLPNLPALRESQFVTMFELGPFDGWQRAFSTKSALSWFDRGGFLGKGMHEGFAPTTQNGGTYLGFASAGMLLTGLLNGALHSTRSGNFARIMLGLGLLMFWLSFGPRSVVGGHFEFLNLSPDAADYTPALAWLLLAAQVWLIFKILPQGSTFWRWASSGMALIYLFVPGFRLIEKLPLFGNIRAPFDFYQVTGSICMIAAVAATAGILLQGVRRKSWRVLIGGGLVLIAAWDAAPYARPIFQPQMDRAVFNDFLAAQKFLKSAPQSGRVYAFSGRYFYLLTPWISGRPLANEAFNSYLQQRGAALLQSSAMLSEESWKSYLRITGVAYLLIDKTDPDNPNELQEKMRSNFKTAFENANMAVLTVPEALGPCFLARDYVQAPNADAPSAMASLGAARYNYAAIQMPGADLEAPGYQGKIVDGRILPKEKAAIQEGAHFLSVPQKSEATYQRFIFSPSGQPGWLVFNQAWHPDWVAIQDGKIEKPQRAFLAFSAVQTDGTHEVTFEFREPWWYNVCIYIGFASWLVVLGFLIIGGGSLSVECTRNSDTLKL